MAYSVGARRLRPARAVLENTDQEGISFSVVWGSVSPVARQLCCITIGAGRPQPTISASRSESPQSAIRSRHRQTARRSCAVILPYSHDFNPIDPVWAPVKQRIRAHPRDALTPCVARSPRSSLRRSTASLSQVFRSRWVLLLKCLTGLSAEVGKNWYRATQIEIG